MKATLIVIQNDADHAEAKLLVEKFISAFQTSVRMPFADTRRARRIRFTYAS